MKTYLKFFAEWRGEPDVGIMPGTEEITIAFKYGQPIDDITVDYWLEVIQEFYDGADVLLIGSSDPLLRDPMSCGKQEKK